MPSIPYLPNETICNIISFLLPQDLDSFTSTCRLYYDLSKDVRRKHMQRKKLYRIVDDDDLMIIPFLIARPKLAWYVRRLIIHNERHNWEDWKRRENSFIDQVRNGDGTLLPPVITDDSLDVIRIGLRNSGLVSATEEDAWMESIKKGVDAPLKLLLLSLAPKLKSLVLNPGRTTMINFPNTSFLYLFGKAIHRAALMPAEVRPRICPELAEIRVSPHRTRQPYLNCLSLRSYEIAPFFLLPTLDSLFIETHMVFNPICDIGEDYPGRDLPLRPQQSSIKNLYIASFGGNTCNDLNHMIEGIKALKSFHIKRPQHNFGIYLQALSQSHAEMLEELNLGVYNSSATDIVSLLYFRALKSLTLEVGFLHNILNAGQKKRSHSTSSNWKLDDVFPVSLELLRISESQIRHSQSLFEGFLSGLADFVDCKPTSHPNLRIMRLEVFQLDYDNDPDFDRLRRACKLHNVLLQGPPENLECYE